MQITIPNMPETLTYAVFASLGIDLIMVILLAVFGDLSGVVLVLAIAFASYWLICHQLVTVISAKLAAACGGIILFVCALIDFATLHPYYGILFVVGAIALAVVFVLLQQGAVPAELRVGGVVLVGTPRKAAQLRMLEELRDAGILSADEFAAKHSALGI